VAQLWLAKNLPAEKINLTVLLALENSLLSVALHVQNPSLALEEPGKENVYFHCKFIFLNIFG